MPEPQEIPIQELPIVEDLELMIPPTPTPWLMILGVSGGIVLGLGIIIFLVVRVKLRHRRIQRMLQPQRTAHKMLDEAFAQWKVLGYVEFLLQATEIMRIYIWQRFHLGAPNLTTNEIAVLCDSTDAFGGETQEQLLEMLHRCDLLKFGSATTAEAEIEQIYNSGKKFVKLTAWRN